MDASGRRDRPTSVTEPARIADLAVVGAGPAGVEAAVAAAGYGLDVVLLDELPSAGGQVYRAVPAAFAPGAGGAEAAAGAALRARLAASPVEVRAGEGVWSVLARAALRAPCAAPEHREPSPPPGSEARPPRAASARTAPPPPSSSAAWDHEPRRAEPGAISGRLEEEAGFLPGSAARFRLDTLGAGGAGSVFAAGLALCPGAVERVLPFPGWTLPGVMGLAAATILLKSQRLLPGRRVVVAGAGPLLAAVAAGILKGGGAVAAVVDLNGPAEWLRTVPRLAAMPRLAARGVVWLARIAGRARSHPVSPLHTFRPRKRTAGSGRGRPGRPGRALVRSTRPRCGTGDRGRRPRGRARSLPGDGDRTPASRGARIRTAIEGDGGRSPTNGPHERCRLLRRRGRRRSARGGRRRALGPDNGGRGRDRRGAARPEHGGRARSPAPPRPCAGSALRRGDDPAHRPPAGDGRGDPPGHHRVPVRGRHPAGNRRRDHPGRVRDQPAQALHPLRDGSLPGSSLRRGGGRAPRRPHRRRSRRRTRAAGQWTGRAPLRPVPMDALAGRFDYEDLPLPPPAPP